MRRPAVTLKALAEACGVSIATASNAFNRPDQLSDALRHRVLRRAEAMGYRGPAIEGRLLRSGHAGAVAVYPREPLEYLLRDPCAVALVESIAARCQARQLGLVLLPSVPRERGTGGRLATALDVAAVDGFLMYCLPDRDPAIERILDRRKAVVAIDMSGDERFAGVNVDDEGGAALAARRLAETGRRRPAILSLPIDARRASGRLPLDEMRRAAFPVTRRRWRGYLKGLRSGGVAVRDLAREVVAVNAERDGRAAAAALLARTPRPDAILAMTDVLALGALEACRERGLGVPEDVAIVGFDDILPAAESAGLTTIRQDVGEKGRLAVERLLGNGDGAGTTLPVTLVVRRSG